MQSQWVINGSYHCKRSGVGDLILVYNSGSYLLANYRELTGELVWQRVIPASEKKAIEEWLNRTFSAANTSKPQHASAN
jgi:hypothetical protein